MIGDTEDVLIIDDEPADKLVESEGHEEEEIPAEHAEAEIEEGEPEPRGAKTLSDAEKVKRRNAALRKTRAENARKDRENAELRQRLAALEQGQQMHTAVQINATAAEADQEIAAARALEQRGYAEGKVELIQQARDIEYAARRKKEIVEQIKRQPQQQQRPAPRQDGPNPEREAWLARNPWFHTDEVRRDAVISASNRLAAQGYAPNSRDHFDALDEALGNRTSRQRPPPMTPGVTRTSSATPEGVTRIPREIYNEWEKHGVFDGLDEKDKKAKLQRLASYYKQTQEKRAAMARRGRA